MTNIKQTGTITITETDEFVDFTVTYDPPIEEGTAPGLVEMAIEEIMAFVDEGVADAKAQVQ